MTDDEWLAERFEEHRAHLRAVAYRILGSLTEADDAVQDGWERASRAGADDVENIGGWLTTIVARVCLNMLRSRHTRREQPLEAGLPDPIVTADTTALDPQDEALLAESVGLALQVVIDTLAPRNASRSCSTISSTSRSTRSARWSAGRRRRRDSSPAGPAVRVKGAETPAPERDVRRQRAVVDAFFAAGRAGDFDALVSLLDPDVVLRADYGQGRPDRSAVVRGTAAVVEQARLGARIGGTIHPALVNGSAGVVVTARGRPVAVMGFTVVDGQIVEIDAIADPSRVRRVAAAVLRGG